MIELNQRNYETLIETMKEIQLDKESILALGINIGKLDIKNQQKILSLNDKITSLIVMFSAQNMNPDLYAVYFNNKILPLYYITIDDISNHLLLLSYLSKDELNIIFTFDEKLIKLKEAKTKIKEIINFLENNDRNINKNLESKNKILEIIDIKNLEINFSNIIIILAELIETQIPKIDIFGYLYPIMSLLNNDEMKSLLINNRIKDAILNQYFTENNTTQEYINIYDKHNIIPFDYIDKDLNSENLSSYINNLYLELKDEEIVAKIIIVDLMQYDIYIKKFLLKYPQFKKFLYME